MFIAPIAIEPIALESGTQVVKSQSILIVNNFRPVGNQSSDFSRLAPLLMSFALAKMASSDPYSFSYLQQSLGAYFWHSRYVIHGISHQRLVVQHQVWWNAKLCRHTGHIASPAVHGVPSR